MNVLEDITTLSKLRLLARQKTSLLSGTHIVTVTAPLITTSATSVTSEAATNALSCAADGPFGRPIACHSAIGLACSSSILYSVVWLGAALPFTATVTVRLSRYDGGPPFSQNERNTDGCPPPEIASWTVAKAEINEAFAPGEVG